MTTPGGSDTFYGSIPVFRGFTRLMEPQLYSPLPDDWSVGVADIVDSTKAIAARRYKAVNMAGAAVIAAVTNARISETLPDDALVVGPLVVTLDLCLNLLCGFHMHIRIELVGSREQKGYQRLLVIRRDG